jgi:Zn-dependent protease
MLGTAETPYDVKFRFLGIPVRIHPLFWLMAAATGWEDRELPTVALWAGCVFVSIMVHEYGHGLVAKAFDGAPSIVLWGLGGLCFSHGDRQSNRQRLAVILSGPGAGFVLLALVVLATFLVTGLTPIDQAQLIGGLFGWMKLPEELKLKLRDAFAALHLNVDSMTFKAYFFLVQINLLWGLVNLLPMWPLDGGQAAQILLLQIDRSRGQRWTHIVSLLTAGVLAVMAYSLSHPPDLYRAIFFGCFAFINFQVLHTLHQAQTMGMYQEDEWWRR